MLQEKERAVFSRGRVHTEYSHIITYFGRIKPVESLAHLERLNQSPAVSTGHSPVVLHGFFERVDIKIVEFGEIAQVRAEAHGTELRTELIHNDVRLIHRDEGCGVRNFSYAGGSSLCVLCKGDVNVGEFLKAPLQLIH